MDADFGNLPFSNSGINKVAMVKNALLPMSLYSLLWVNEIIRYHLPMVLRKNFVFAIGSLAMEKRM